MPNLTFVIRSIRPAVPVASDPRPTTSEDHAPAAIASAGVPLRLAHTSWGTARPAITAPPAMNIQPVIPMSTRPDPCRFDN